MTWNSGACGTPVGGTTWISTDAYPEPIRIDDADVRADEAERLAEADVGLTDISSGRAGMRVIVWRLE